MVTVARARLTNAILSPFNPKTMTPNRSHDASVTLHAPSWQFVFRDKAACVAYYREAMATWAAQTLKAVDDAMTEADAYLAQSAPPVAPHACNMEPPFEIMKPQVVECPECGRRMEWVPPMIFRLNGYKPGDGE